MGAVVADQPGKPPDGSSSVGHGERTFVRLVEQADPDVHRVAVHGEIDMSTVADLSAQLAEVLARVPRHRTLHIDMAAVEFLSVAGARALFDAALLARSQEVTVRLVGCHPVHLRIIGLAWPDLRHD
jgi:anti-anti-sigma factor